MLALLLAASLLSTISRNACLVAAQPQLRSHVEFMAALAQAPQFVDLADEFAWDAMVRARPGSQVALALRALLRERAGDLQSTVEDLARLEQACGSTEWSREYVANCRYRLGIQKKELDWLLAFVQLSPSKFLDTYSEDARDCGPTTRNVLLHLLDHRIGNRTDDNAALCLRGILHHIGGRLPAAIRDYRTALWNRPNDADLLLFLASAQARMGNNHGALLSARDAASFAPNCGATQRLLASLLMRYKRYDEAIAPATLAISLNPDPAIDYFLRGVCLAHIGEFKRGLDDLRREPEDNDWWSMVTYERCLTRVASNELDAALADADRLVARFPGERYFRLRGLVHGVRGESIAEFCDFARAASNNGEPSAEESDSEDASKGFNPRSTSFHFDLLDLLSHSQRYECRLRYALTLILVGQRSEAAEDLNDLTTYEKSGSFGRLVQGCYLATGGDYAGALGEFRQALSVSKAPKPDSLILTGWTTPAETNKSATERTELSLTPADEAKQKDEKKSSTEYLDRGTLTEVMADKDGRVPALNPVPWSLEQKDSTPPVKRKDK